MAQPQEFKLEPDKGFLVRRDKSGIIHTLVQYDLRAAGPQTSTAIETYLLAESQINRDSLKHEGKKLEPLIIGDLLLFQIVDEPKA